MGCVSSSAKEDRTEDTLDPAAEAIAKKQRRRLSVAPHHVGDISAAQAAERKEAEDDNEGLTEVEIKAKGNLKCAAKTRKGIVPYNRNKVNQDRAIVKFALQDDPDISLFGVMDGHGEYGHYVASFTQEKLPYWLAHEKNLKQDPDTSIHSAVKNMCDELHRTNINVAFSGTTCVFGLKLGQTLYVGNIGDSRCVLARRNSNGQIEAVPLSNDQKPEVPSEKARILKAGGRVEPLPGPPGEDCGPPRVWLKDVDVPGLAMSRSIGDDVSQTVGVTSIPEITRHDISSQDLFIVWASDGVWEFISNEQAVDLIVSAKGNLKEGASRLIEESSKRWKQEEEVVDDITCVIIAFGSDSSGESTKTESIVLQPRDSV